MSVTDEKLICSLCRCNQEGKESRGTIKKEADEGGMDIDGCIYQIGKEVDTYRGVCDCLNSSWRKDTAGKEVRLADQR